MSDSLREILDYYTKPGITTDPGDCVDLFADLPTNIDALCRVVQGLLIHINWAPGMGETLSEARKKEMYISPISAMLARIAEINSQPLTVERPLSQRLVSSCRDFAIMLCAMLRHQGVPARARCGFGAYFTDGRYEDHWVTEYWNTEKARWVLVDSQLDAFQRDALKVTFDTLDMPPGQFVTGGAAWLMCRNEGADPQLFGIYDMHGMAFIRGDVVRDFLALNRVAIQPWEDWGLIVKSDDEAIRDEPALIDRMAQLATGGNDTFSELRQLYASDSRLTMPSDWQP